MSIRTDLKAGVSALVLILLSTVQPSFAAPDSGTAPETVVVTATRSATALTDIPESVSVVTTEQIANTPAQGLDDILRDLPGLTLTNIGPDVGKCAIG